MLFCHVSLFWKEWNVIVTQATACVVDLVKLNSDVSVSFVLDWCEPSKRTADQSNCKHHKQILRRFICSGNVIHRQFHSITRLNYFASLSEIAPLAKWDLHIGCGLLHQQLLAREWSKICPELATQYFAFLMFGQVGPWGPSLFVFFSFFFFGFTSRPHLRHVFATDTLISIDNALFGYPGLHQSTK